MPRTVIKDMRMGVIGPGEKEVTASANRTSFLPPSELALGNREQQFVVDWEVGLKGGCLGSPTPEVGIFKPEARVKVVLARS